MSAPVAPTISDRLLTALRLIIRAELPQLSFLGVYEYAIQMAYGSTIDCTPTDTTISLPPLGKVPVRFGFVDVSVSASDLGKRCLIMFINGDPSRPVCVSMDPDPAGLARQIARLGDPIVGGGGGVIGPCTSRATSG